MGVVTGKGLLGLVREHYGWHGTVVALPALVVANLGTLCAEFAGIAVGLELVGGVSRYVSVPVAAVGVSALVLRGSFRRVEHILLALSAMLLTYVAAGFLARPDWTATAKGLVVPSIPLTREALLVAVATVGTTLAPWGLAFIQSYAVNKQAHREDGEQVVIGDQQGELQPIDRHLVAHAMSPLLWVYCGPARGHPARSGGVSSTAGLDPELLGGHPRPLEPRGDLLHGYVASEVRGAVLRLLVPAEG